LAGNNGISERREKLTPIKAKDTPWDAVLMGSVVCTVATNVRV